MAEPSSIYSDLTKGSDSDKELLVIPSDCPWDGDWELAADLVVEIQTSGEEVLAIAHQLTVEEHGAGASVEEAVQDLLTSLSDYRECLEEREARLGATAVADLARLRHVIRRCSHMST